jgi:3-hydroxyacyl-CoA dehydrogenase
MAQEVRTVAIVGCGVIGMGWAVLFMSCGLKVIISDPAPGAHESLKRYLEQSRSFFQERGDFDKLSSNYEFVDDILPRLPEVDFVQEVSTFISNVLLQKVQLKTNTLLTEWSRAC